MPMEKQHFTPREAARLMGDQLSHHQEVDTERQVEDGPDPGGHHRLSESSLKSYLAADKLKPESVSRERYRALAAGINWRARW